MRSLIKGLSFLLLLLFFSCRNYDSVNLFPVSNNEGKYGFIDQSGKLAISYNFDFAHRFFDNRALVLMEGKAYYINKKGKILFEASIEPKRRLKTSNVLGGSIDITYDKDSFIKISDIYFFQEGLAAYYDTTLRAFGYINTKGNIIIESKFFEVNRFSEGLAAVKLKDTLTTNSTLPTFESEYNNIKYGYINSTGNFVIDPIFHFASDFSNGKAFVNIQADDRRTNTGISIDTDGYVINKEGQTLSPNIKNTIAWNYSEGFLPAYNFIINLFFSRGYFFIDSSYNHYPIFEGEKIFFKDITTFSDGIAGVLIDTSWLVVDTKMNVITEEKFSNVKACTEGLMPVKKGNKWIYLNTVGLYAFDLEFDSCNKFFDRLAYVETYENNSTIKGYINRKGEYVWQNIILNKKVRY
ncbi:MAG: WG repeat-containing protein [Acholeplasma sp.]|nr:WG repeat-containing protein [Acholeplasma sp.]